MLKIRSMDRSLQPELTPERRFTQSPYARAAVIASAWFLLTSPVWILLWRNNAEIAGENQAMEWAQIILLGAATLAFARRWMQSAESELKVVFAAIALVLYSFLFREMELHKLRVAPAVKAIDPIGTSVALCLWLVFVALCYKRLPALPKRGLPLLRTTWGMLLALGAALYLCSWPFDRLHVTMAGLSGVFLEELMEFHATSLFGVAGIFPQACELPQSSSDP